MIRLQRCQENPILTPSNHLWENMLVFNPGVTEFEGFICLLYRAMGKSDQISRLGFGASKDGIHFQRNDHPLYYAKGHEFETLGIEDARISKIDDTYYLVYTAVSEDVKASPRVDSRGVIAKQWFVGMSSTKDFKEFVDYDLIIPGVMGKNAALFPKKINGEYWLLYRVGLGTTFFARSKQVNYWPEKTALFDRRLGSWDSVRAGVGAPPIETEKGWLLFYHGVDEYDVYRLGIIFLDLQNPCNILYRSPNPIFEPETPYEKSGFVSNVVFTCGAIEKDDTYYVYYGAGDTVTGLATVAKKDVLRLF